MIVTLKQRCCRCIDRIGGNYAHHGQKRKLTNTKATKTGGKHDKNTPLNHKRSTKKNGTKNGTFSFLEFPAEIRNAIYEYCLVDPQQLTLVSSTKALRHTVCRGRAVKSSPSDWHTPGSISYVIMPENLDAEKEGPLQSLCPALLAVCRQIQSEAAPILYGQAIYVQDTHALHAFISNMSNANCLLIQDLDVIYWTCHRGAQKTMNHPAMTTLSRCSNLKHMRFDCDIARDYSKNHFKMMARQLYRECHIWFETFGAAKGRFDAALDVLELHPRNFCHKHSWTAKEDERMAICDGNKALFHTELRGLLKSRVVG